MDGSGLGVFIPRKGHLRAWPERSRADVNVEHTRKLCRHGRNDAVCIGSVTPLFQQQQQMQCSLPRHDVCHVPPVIHPNSTLSHLRKPDDGDRECE